MIEQTLDELGISDVATGSAHHAALTTMLRRLIAGKTSPRDLAQWAHRYIGHEGDADCQVFVDLDDMYDTADYSGFSETELDEWALEEAHAFLEGRPSPGRTAVWRTPPPSSQPEGRLARLVTRLRRH
jgi:hypothetical protein